MGGSGGTWGDLAVHISREPGLISERLMEKLAPDFDSWVRKRTRSTLTCLPNLHVNSSDPVPESG
jgi:hypothetical protein